MSTSRQRRMSRGNSEADPAKAHSRRWAPGTHAAAGPEPATAAPSANRRRRRGSRGRGSTKRPEEGAPASDDGVTPPLAEAFVDPKTPDLPDPPREGKASPEAAERAIIRRP